MTFNSTKRLENEKRRFNDKNTEIDKRLAEVEAIELKAQAP